MIKICIAKSAGFCFGVDKAVKLTYKALEDYPTVATLGPIIHNKYVVDDMINRGARIIDNVSDLQKGECVVIRSHGVSCSVYDELYTLGNPYVDATCPFVSKIHRIVTEHTENGDYILIAGDKKHAEVISIVGHCKENCTVFADDTELKKFFESKYKQMQKILPLLHKQLIIH